MTDIRYALSDRPETAVELREPAPRAPLGLSLQKLGLTFGGTLAGIPLFALFLALWEIAPRAGWLSPIFFPPLSEVVADWLDLAWSGVLIENTGISLQRAGIGFGLAVLVAVPLGFLMGHYPRFERITDLLVQTLRNTSYFALMPVFILLLGIGEESKVAVTFYASVFFLLINTIAGVKTVDPILVRAARSMGTGDLDLFRKVILPASIPSIVAGARLAVKSSIFAVIAAEMLGAKSGIGFFIQQSQLMMQTQDMYAGILTLTIVGVLINYLLVWFENSVTSWHSGAGRQGS
ncbi:MAG TPA: ABC transporter permease [Xanthobacteraceae bacterium]|nr:ABC transporter permease [Xanthobacteraceae bacterium]